MRLRKARSEGHPGPVGGMSLEPEWLGTMCVLAGMRLLWERDRPSGG